MGNNIFGFTPTNTFDSVNFDALTVGGIEDPLVDLYKLSNLCIDESYFVLAVNHIKESRTEYNTYKKKLYTSIMEAENSHIILESFSDFFTKVKEIIDKFLKFIKSLFQKFLTALASLVNSDSYLKKHKKDFNDFKDVDKFDFEGYNYTFNPGIPVAVVDLNLSSITNPIYTMDNITTGSITGVINNITNDRENRADVFRGKVLGKSESIYETDFANELFRIYRDNEDTTDTIEATPMYIHTCVKRFFNYSNAKSYTEKEYKRIEKEYKNLEEEIKDITSRNGDLNAKAFIDNIGYDNKGNMPKIDNNIVIDGLKMSAELMQKIDAFVKVQVDHIQDCSNIHTLAFSAKLDAMKECANQDRKTLYRALQKIQRTDARRKKEA